jgi:hypothetical protein
LTLVVPSVSAASVPLVPARMALTTSVDVSPVSGSVSLPSTPAERVAAAADASSFTATIFANGVGASLVPVTLTVIVLVSNPPCPSATCAVKMSWTGGCPAAKA